MTDILSNTQFVSPGDLAFVKRGRILGNIGKDGKDISGITTLLRSLSPH